MADEAELLNEGLLEIRLATIRLIFHAGGPRERENADSLFRLIGAYAAGTSIFSDMDHIRHRSRFGLPWPPFYLRSHQ